MRYVPTSIFIDTEVFFRANLNFETKSLKSLRETFARGELRLLISPIMERELIGHFQDRASKVAGKLINAHKVHPVKLLSLQDLPSREELESRCLDELMRQWREFKQHFLVEELPFGGKVEEVFSWYFDGDPPFGQGKKKHEFPDAFVLSALDDYNKEHEANIAVISKDGDFAIACKQRRFMAHYYSIEDYIEEFRPELESQDLERPEIDPTIPIVTEDLSEIKTILMRGSDATPIEIERVMKLLESRGTNYEYFFLHVTDDVWLEPLICHGYFTDPPDAAPVRYLARVYETQPDVVIEQIEKLPETSNPHILGAIIDIILKADSAEVVNRLSSKILAFVDHAGRGHG